MNKTLTECVAEDYDKSIGTTGFAQVCIRRCLLKIDIKSQVFYILCMEIGIF